MPTTRGFVQKIDIGRAGLVTVTLIHTDGSSGNYVIEDLDADPERFNERLSKLAILRDAMNRAEPVEIEHTGGDAGQTIQRAARISRDALEPPTQVLTITGLVIDVLLHSENNATATGERHDFARVHFASFDGGEAHLVLNMQGPERLVKDQQLEMIRQAQAENSLVRLLVDTADNAETFEIIAVSVIGDLGSLDERGLGEDLHGFVESLSLIRQPGKGDPSGIFALVQFTTAPPFTGSGNTIGLTPFTPERIDLLVPRHSLAYELFEAGLRANLRMRVRALILGARSEGSQRLRDEEPAAESVEKGGSYHGLRAFVMSRLSHEIEKKKTIGLVLGAELLAHLASASRPVWITVSRKSLDHGPDGYACTPGVPSSDLTPRTLRDLRIPYPACWTGVGCFNPGVYRFQIQLPCSFKLFVDGKELCLHDAAEASFTGTIHEIPDAARDSEPFGTPGTVEYVGTTRERKKGSIKLAYACLSGEHVVEIVIDAWICDYDFIFDVYQIR